MEPQNRLTERGGKEGNWMKEDEEIIEESSFTQITVW